MIYKVQAGDTVYAISQATGVSVEKIIYDNQLPESGDLVVGQALLIQKEGAGEDYRQGLFVTGYAYPFIERSVLEQCLVAVNEVLVFSYGFTFAGDLIPPMWEDQWLVEATKEKKGKAFLVLTPFSEGTFNNELVRTLVESEDVQTALLQNLLETLEAKGFAGVDVDFEYVLSENRQAYARFVGKLRSALEPKGYQVSVALAPKTSAEQAGLLYEGVDYRALGENADSVFLMTYEWGYTYGPPMAVAPLHKVRQVVEYALSEIPQEKIVMGIPNYGYEWQLPYEKGVTKAKLLGNVEAVNLARENGAEILFDEQAQSPHYSYQKNGETYEVWFEDVRSVAAKLALAKEFGLYGVGFWNLMRPFRANWLMLA